MKSPLITSILILSIFILSIQACRLKPYDYSAYWRKRLPVILADTSSHFYADTLIKNANTALEIAEPILAAKFGQKTINSQKPLKAVNVDNYWIIDGTLPRYKVGGTATVILRATDGKIMQLTHYR